VLPERLDARGSDDDLAKAAQPLESSRALAWAAGLAKELGIDLIAGSVAERREGRDRLGNTSVHIGPDGEIKAIYRKIHMFDVEVGETVYRESAHSEAADEIVLTETAAGVPVGMTICYDLRFPELHRILALRGARVVVVPSNVTKVTGQAHWEILLRARAIENQVFVIAPAQAGRQEPDGESFGNSMIVDPWGEVLARAGEEETFIAADLDLGRQDEIRRKLPSLANRAAGAYRWPEEVRA
jgi:deaminated glutathione amidase